MKSAGDAAINILVVLIVLVAALPPPNGLAVAGVQLELAPPSIASAAPDDGRASGERTPAARGVPESLAATAVELALLELTNAERVRHGLTPARTDPAVLTIARARADQQLTQEALSHYDAAGRPIIASLLVDAGVEYRLAGENLARWVVTDPAGPARVQQALMGSPSHRGNILEPSFDRLAVGAATDASGRIAFAQIFREAP